MNQRNPYDISPEQIKKTNYAKKLEWWSIFFLITITVVMYLTMGSSQAMKTAWVEDIWSMIPPIVFLVTVRIQKRKPNQRYPYGFFNVGSIAFLSAATAVFLLGIFMLYDSGRSLITMEHPSIGMVHILGFNIWSGWIMIAALIYSAIPPVILGHLKKSAAKEIHSKTLIADAAMNQADWTTAVAAIIGILGVGLGYWWADAVMAGLIAIDITRDGYTNLSLALADLLNKRPTKVDEDEPDPLVSELARHLSNESWIQDLEIRLREEGSLLAGEIFIIPHLYTDDLYQKMDALRNKALNFHWRIYDIVVSFADYQQLNIINKEITQNPTL